MQPPSPRILIVDDLPDNILLIRQILARAGLPACVGETDPRQAIARFHAEDFDLVLLDYNMPHLSGLEVLAAIGEQSRSRMIPVVMVTARDDRDTRLMSLNAGARDFIAKPIDEAELVIRVNTLLEIRRLHGALAEQNRALDQLVAQRTEELHSTRLEVIRRLARAAEFRDNETGTHVQRMSLYAEAIGRRLGLDEHDLDLLLNASPMHDLGKIGISDSILRKPGKLTEEEFRTMQMHAVIGANILHGHNSRLLQAAHDIALHHHERWDGQGYPHGLAGESIPLFARIAAVADVFDALTMRRPYKRAWSMADSRAEILRLAGAHFDPAIVEAFDHCFDDIVRIHRANPDAEEEYA